MRMPSTKKMGLGIPVAISCLVTFGVGLGVVQKTERQVDARQTRFSNEIPTTRSLAAEFKIESVLGNRKEGYQVTLRNDYNKGVVAFDIGQGSATGDRAVMIRELLYQDQVIAPGATWVEYQPYDPDMEKLGLTVFGVVFDDGTGAGLPDSIRQIKHLRLGRKLQLERLRPILKRALELTDSNPLLAIETLESEVLALPIESELSPDVRSELYMQKQILLREVQGMKDRQEQRRGDRISILQEGRELRKELSKLDQDAEQLSARLTKNAVE
jgi:hypothetical protein